MSQLNIDNIANQLGTGGPDFVGMPSVGGDPVVESGSNSDGEWVRWANGTQHCFTSRAGASNPHAWSYPLAFISAPTLLGNVESNAARFTSFSERFAASVNVYAWVSDTATVSTQGEFILATGRWK